MAITTLYASIEGILEAVETYLIDEMEDGGKLSEIKSYGLMSSDMPTPPYPGLWWSAGTLSAPSILTSVREIWEMPIVIASLTWSDQPDTGSVHNTKPAAEGRTGGILANKLASDARGILLDSCNLGLDYVSGLKSDRFDPAAPVDRKKQTFSALALVNVTFATTRS